MTRASTTTRRLFVVLLGAVLAWSAAAAVQVANDGIPGATASAAVPILDTLVGEDEDDPAPSVPAPAPAPAPDPEPPPPPPEAPPPEAAPPETQAAAEDQPAAVGPHSGSAGGPMLQPGNMPAEGFEGGEPFAGDAPAPMVAPGVEVAPPMSDAPMAAPPEQLASSPGFPGAGAPEPAVPELVILSVLAVLLLRYQRRSRARFQPRF